MKRILRVTNNVLRILKRRIETWDDIDVKKVHAHNIFKKKYKSLGIDKITFSLNAFLSLHKMLVNMFSNALSIPEQNSKWLTQDI